MVALGSLGGVSFPAISSIKANNVADSEQGTIQARVCRRFTDLALWAPHCEGSPRCACCVHAEAAQQPDSKSQHVQGALYGARALATGTGPLLFAAMFSAFTKSDSPLPYFPGAPFLLGTALMTVAIGYSLLIDNRSASLLTLPRAILPASALIHVHRLRPVCYGKSSAMRRPSSVKYEDCCLAGAVLLAAAVPLHSPRRPLMTILRRR